MLKLSKNGKEIKEVDKFDYLERMVEKNGKIQNAINERLGKALKLHHLAKSLLRNKDIDRKCKLKCRDTDLYYKREKSKLQAIQNRSERGRLK
jgi:hypothetical protein